jgi:O-antigen/teichoic acid export membrane protein
MFGTEVSTGVLQVGGHFKCQSLINFIQSVITASIIFYAYLTRNGILMVLWAYLIGKLIAGLGPTLLALIQMPSMLGREWWKAPLKELPPLEELIGFGVSTNVSGTINMVVRDSELLWVGFLFNSQIAGYYKTAKAILNLVVMPINPFISTTYPEITRSIAKKQWGTLQILLRRVTLISGAWTTATAAGLAVAGNYLLFTRWIPWRGELHSIYKPEFSPALPILLILLIGYGLANTFYWNRSLLLGFGRADIPLRVAFYGTVVKVILTLTLVQRLGYIWEAVFLSLYFLVTVGVLVWYGIKQIRTGEMTAS